MQVSATQDNQSDELVVARLGQASNAWDCGCVVMGTQPFCLTSRITSRSDQSNDAKTSFPWSVQRNSSNETIQRNKRPSLDWSSSDKYFKSYERCGTTRDTCVQTDKNENNSKRLSFQDAPTFSPFLTIIMMMTAIMMAAVLEVSQLNEWLDWNEWKCMKRW